MVAFATDYEPQTATVEPKNRVGDFFWPTPDRVGIDRSGIRTLAGENGWFSYDACRNPSLAHGKKDAYASGEWIDEMVAKHGRRNVERFLRAYLTEYSERLDAHREAFERLSPSSSIDDMKAMVESIRPGSYPAGRSTSNSVNPRTGQARIAPYVPSRNMHDDLNSFLNHHMGAVHEPVHVRDIALNNYVNSGFVGASVQNGWFGAYTEIGAYQANVDALRSALDRIK